MLGFELWEQQTAFSSMLVGAYWDIQAVEEARAAVSQDAARFEVAILENGIASIYMEDARFLPLTQFRLEFAHEYADCARKLGEGWLDRLDK